MSGYIKHLPVLTWFDIFFDCHQFIYDGSLLQSKQKGKHIKFGQYIRLDWPVCDTPLNQSNVVVEVFNIILNEQNQMTFNKVK